MNVHISPPVVLMIDDNPADIFLMRHATTASGMPVKFQSAPDASSAIEYLKGNSTPDLLILDFFLNGETGPEVLERIRTSTGVRTRAVMLSGLDPRVVKRAYASQVESHQKPDSVDGWLELAKHIFSSPIQTQATPSAA